jgi:hypothetical protein
MEAQMTTISLIGECHTMGTLSEEDAIGMCGQNKLSYSIGGREFYIVGLTIEEMRSLPNLLYKESTINLQIEVAR